MSKGEERWEWHKERHDETYHKIRNAQFIAKPACEDLCSCVLCICLTEYKSSGVASTVQLYSKSFSSNFSASVSVNKWLSTLFHIFSYEHYNVQWVVLEAELVLLNSASVISVICPLIVHVSSLIGLKRTRKDNKGTDMQMSEFNKKSK